MMKLLLAVLLLASSTARAQFAPGSVLTAAQLNSAFAAKLSLTGGALSGPLTAPSLSLTGTATLPSVAITGGTITGLSAPVPVASGGTGAATQSAALAGLLGSSAVPITNGGTGATTQAGALSAILGFLTVPIANGGTGASTATGATSQLQYLQGAAGSITRSVTSKLQDFVTVADFSAAAQAASAAAGGYFLVPQGTTVTLNVPSQFSTITAALAAIQNWWIYGNVTIQVADGNYASGSPITFNHPFGQNVSIIGDVTTPANCILSFSTSDGIDIASNTTLGYINGFDILNTGTKANFGIATYGGRANIGPNVIVDSFYYGIAALNGGQIYANGTSTSNRVEVRNTGDAGIWAIGGSFISATYAYVHDSVDTTNNLGGGIVAEFASSIVANSATSSHNYLANIISQSGSGVRAWNGTYSYAGTLTNGTTNPNTSTVANVITNSLGAMEIFTSAVSNSLGYGDSSDGTGQLFGGSGSSTYASNALGNSRQPAQYSNSGAALTVTDYSNSNATFTVNGATDANGGIIKIIGNGATTPNKFIQVYGGVFNIISSSYATPIFSLTDAGAMSVPGSIAHTQQEIDKSYTYSTPATGAAVTMGAGTETAIINPAGTLVALTITLPACTSGYDGSIARYSSTQTITALTVNATSGTVSNAPTTLAAGAGHADICRGSNTTWYPLY